MMKRSSYRDRDYAFGQTMLTLRAAIGVTQPDLASYLGVSRFAVGAWEAGSTYPKAEHLKQFIALAVQQRIFPTGREVDEIRALWKASQQKVLLDETWLAQLLPFPADQQSHRITQTSSTRGAHRHWEEALAVDVFYGRDWELKLLTEWVLKQQCRVVTILGPGGIGKSALAVHLMRQIADDFDVVIWRSLRDLPTCDGLLTSLLQVLTPQSLSESNDSFEQRLTLLMGQLRETHVLVVLDNVESVLEGGDITGYMRPGYEDFGRFLAQIATTQHQSTILLTSRQKPDALLPHEGNQTPVRTLRLAALDNKACEQLLAAKEVSGSASERHRLIQTYGGNPLAIKIVAQTIVDLFDGVIAPFLDQGGVIFGGVYDLLREQYARLSPIEQCVVFWLAIMREPVTISELQALFVTPLLPAIVLDTLNRLYRHSLIERGQTPGSFTLQSVVLEYLTEHLVAEICDEILRGDFALLTQHGLEQAHAKNYVRQTQERLLVMPVLGFLRSTYPRSADLEAVLKERIEQIRELDETAQGYAPANLITLLRSLHGHLSELDLSRLVLRHMSLQGVQMHDTSLNGAIIRHCAFHEAFDGITSLSMNSTGEYWAAAESKGGVLIWLSQGGHTVIRHLHPPNIVVVRVALSPDGQTVAGANWDGTVKLWNVTTGLLIWSSDQIPGVQMIHWIAFAPDGSMIATTSNDGLIRLWDATTGALLDAFGDAFPALTWRHDSQMLATGTVNGIIQFWAIHRDTTAALVNTIHAHTQTIPSLAFSPDGSMIASGSFDQTVKVWSTKTGHLQETLATHPDRIFRVDWSLDGKTIAASDRTADIQLWDVEHRRCRAVLRGHRIVAKGIIFTPDSQELMSSSEDGTLRLWNVQNGESLQVLHGYSAQLNALSWSPDSKHIACVGVEPILTIYSLNDETLTRRLHGHVNRINDVEWSPAAHIIASSESGNLIRLWDAGTGELRDILSYPNDLANHFYDMAWSPDGTRLATGTSTHGLQIFDMKTRVPHSTHQVTSGAIDELAWSPNGKHIAANSHDGNIYIWDMEGALIHQLSGHQGRPFRMGWSRDGTRLASCGGAGEVGELMVWDAQSGKVIQVFKDHPGIAISVVWASADQFLITGGADGMLRWWDVEATHCVLAIRGHQSRITALEISSDGSMVASCSETGIITVHDAQSGELIKTLRPDRPYERMDITGIRGLTEAQKATLHALGAIQKDIL